MPSDRRAARRGPTSRPPRPVNAVRRTAGPPVPRDAAARAGLTTRAAVLGLVVCALVVSAALPLREYLSQRGQIAAAQQRQALVEHRVASLKEQLTLLQDPDYVREQARTRLHFVLPNETAYVVLAPTAQPSPVSTAAVAGATATGPEAPWYSQVWGSVRAADHPVVLPSAQPTKKP